MMIDNKDLHVHDRKDEEEKAGSGGAESRSWLPLIIYSDGCMGKMNRSS
jgi:hypothetical protein